MFTQLPVELVDNIVKHTLPDGFESMSMTCKRIYERCTPFFDRHRELRSRFHNFQYYLRPSSKYGNLVSACDMIKLIAAEPDVAPYIQTATFQTDSRFLSRQFLQNREHTTVPSIEDGGSVVELFSNSAYLKEAELDWKEYYTAFEEDIRERRYSQHGAAFLLTLLPNIEKLIIPRIWKPNKATDKLLAAIVSKAKKSNSSLSSVTRFEGGEMLNPSDRFDLTWACPFLSLPKMRSFRGPSCLAIEAVPRSVPFRYLQSRYTAEVLEAAHLVSCCIDHSSIAIFLQHTPSLKTLRYWHSTKMGVWNQDWDVCKFVEGVEREVGSHLVQLSITIHDFHGSILPGKASIRGFQRLETLEIPLELVMCNIATAGDSTDSCAAFGDLIPDSVAQLSLVSKGFKPHEEAIEALICYFQSRYNSRGSALKEIHISCPYEASDVYKELCDKAVKEGTDKGLVVHLKPFPSTYRFLWDGEP